jgi:hypothetical protein
VRYFSILSFFVLIVISYFQVTAASRELHQTPRCYSAIVANKILHGGARVPARTKRVTLFLLFSPPASFPLYEDTIPVTTFLLKDANGELVKPSQSRRREEIEAWCRVVRVSFHYKLESQFTSPFQKALIKELEAVENGVKRRVNEELEGSEPKKRVRRLPK